MQRLGLLLRFAVTGALLYWVLSRVQLNRLGPIILDISPLTLAVALGLYFIGVILIGSARWSLLLASQGVSAPFAQLVQSYLVATFFNNVLPTNIGGDVFRIQDGARYTASRTLSTAVIFVDRLLGFAALFALAIAGALLGGAMVRSLPGLDWLWVGLAGVTLLILVVLVAPGIMAWGLSPLNRLNSSWVTARVEVVLSALFRFRRQVPALAKALGISLLIQGSIVLFYFAVATAMGIPLPLDYCLFITPLILVAQLLPSINGFGVRESAFVFFFRTIGLSPEQAVALSFVSTGVIVLLSLAGGAIYAFRSR